MSCHEVVSMLSAYIDGEVQDSDAEMIKSHLGECDSCAAECKALQSMTGMLRTTPEVEPPAFLLAQIEAATVKRAGFLARLQRAFDQVPTTARWAAAPVAAAVILLGILLSNPGDVRTPVVVKSPTERVESAVPGTPSITVEEKTTPSGSKIAVRRHVVKTGWKSHSERRLTGSSLVASNGTVDRVVADSDAGKTARSDEPKPEEPVASDAFATAGGTAESGPDVAIKSPDTDQPVTVAKAPTEKPAKKAVTLDEQPSGIDLLRAKLAKKARAKYNSQEDRLEGKKYSVELVSLRF